MASTLPRDAAGIGLRAPHYARVLETRPGVDFLEVHSENFFAAGGAALAWLERFRCAHAMSFHGVGLSLGSADALDEHHLGKLEALVRRFDPDLVSEHLCWGFAGGRHANDLLPLPHSEEALRIVVAHVDQVQERLKRRILVENVSSYVRMPGSMHEWEFLAECAKRSGCGVLLDVNNVWVSSVNHGFDARAYVDAIDPASVGEIHLAGHESDDGMLIDTHSRRVCDEVWALYGHAIDRIGPRPTLIEWDADIPGLEVLLDESSKARAVLEARAGAAA